MFVKRSIFNYGWDKQQPIANETVIEINTEEPNNGEIWQHESTGIVPLRGVYQGDINKQKYIHFNAESRNIERDQVQPARENTWFILPYILLFMIRSTLKAIITAALSTFSGQSAPAAITGKNYRP